MASEYELLEIIGKEALLAIQQDFKSRYIYIPVDHKISVIQPYIDKKTNRLVSEKLRGEHVWISQSLIIRKRDDEIRKLRSIGGLDANSIGKRYGLTARRAFSLFQNIKPHLVYGMSARRRRALRQENSP